MCLCTACVVWNTGFDQFLLTLKSIPTVAMKLPPRNAPSLKRTRTQVFPTAESPSSITYRCQGQREPLVLHSFNLRVHCRTLSGLMYYICPFVKVMGHEFKSTEAQCISEPSCLDCILRLDASSHVCLSSFLVLV